jgi:hypothetical protein
VTATLDKAPAAAVVAAIAAQTGAEVRGQVLGAREVTLDLDAVPVEDALERVLGTQSFTLTYLADGGLKRIALGGDPIAAVLPPGQNQQVLEATKQVGAFIQANPPVNVSKRLGKALGTRTPTFQEVLKAALKNEDPRVRTEARRTMVEALTDDPEVRAALVTTVDGMQDASLVQSLRGVAGLDAAALAQAFARYGRSPTLTHRMEQVIPTLLKPADG